MNVCWKAVFGDWNSLNLQWCPSIFVAVIYDEFSQAVIMESHSHHNSIHFSLKKDMTTIAVGDYMVPTTY